MGLDIYFYKLRKSDNYDRESSLECVYEEAKAQNKEKLKKAIKRIYKRLILSSVDSVAYPAEYAKQVKNLFKYFSYPSVELDKVGVDYNFKENKYVFTPYYPDSFESEMKDIIEDASAPHCAYFRKTNCLYAYFQYRLVDEMAWVDKEDLEDIVDRAQKILKKHSLADELLPTQDGFFFGSTDYDGWYFQDLKDIVKQFKPLINKWKDDEVMFVHMSW